MREREESKRTAKFLTGSLEKQGLTQGRLQENRWGVAEHKEFNLEHVKFEMPIIHPSGHGK